MSKIFNEHITAVFSAMNTNYDGMSNLMKDLALGREIVVDGRTVSKAEANAKVLEFSHKILGITDAKDAKAVRRAIRDNGKHWFDVIEDTIQDTVSVGLLETDWFNDLVENKSIGYHDRQDFIVENDAILSVAKAGTSHHDHIIQRLGAGQRYTVPTDLYVVKVGADINKYVTGQIDWQKLVEAIDKAFIAEIQNQVYAELSTAATKLPVQTGFVGTGTLSSATKAQFDDIIDNVSSANNGAEVIVVGTKAALSKISALADVQWGAKDQKDSVMNTGNIGIYEGTRLVTMPNRFKDKTFTAKVFPSNKLLILPAIGDEGKFIKFVDEGDTQIVEKTERGDYVSDIQTYEVQRRFGVGTVIGRQFGQWTI